MKDLSLDQLGYDQESCDEPSYFFMDLILKIFDKGVVKIDFKISGLQKGEIAFWLAKEITISELKHPIFIELKQLLIH